MNGSAFIQVAIKLAPSRDEAERRTAVSRAYYAAFHAGRDFFDDLGFRVPRAEAAHVYVSRRLSAATSVPSLTAVGNDLNTLRGYRNQADYDMHLAMSLEKVAAGVEMAKNILAELAKKRSPAEQSALIAEIEAYETKVLRESTRRS